MEIKKTYTMQFAHCFGERSARGHNRVAIRFVLFALVAVPALVGTAQVVLKEQVPPVIWRVRAIDGSPHLPSPVDAAELVKPPEGTRPIDLIDAGPIVPRPLDIVATRGEIAAASVAVHATNDAKRVELVITGVAAEGKALPVEWVDVHVVVAWYQADGAWYQPEGKPSASVRVAELLLKDAGLVTVDNRARKNLIRVNTGEQIPRADSDTLQPIALSVGDCQRYWVRVRVPEKATPGIYHATLTLMTDGRSAGTLPLNVRVLPFELPSASARYDRARPFGLSLGKDPFDKAVAAMLPPLPPKAAAPSPDAIRQIDADLAAGVDVFRERGVERMVQVEAGLPDRDVAARWHVIDSRLLADLRPLLGIENPEVWRRAAGFAPFKADYDGCYLAGVCEAGAGWDDTPVNGYRRRNLVYPVAKGMVETLASEGVRIACDDVRYYALLTRLAEEAMASASHITVYEGRRALHWFDQADVVLSDLDTIRLEAIAWILKLRTLLGKEGV